MADRQLKTMFVTVGTTKFDDLVKVVSSEEFIKVSLTNGNVHVIPYLDADDNI